MDIVNLSAYEIAARVRDGDLDGRDVAAAFRARVATHEGAVGAFLSLNDKEPPARADGPLAGVPVAVKDNICADCLPTTAASRILENYHPPYNATVVEKLRAAGAYVLGKTNLDEFAMGSSTEYSAFKPTRNPRDLARAPGGSSGGSAAAVCAGFAPLALGSDTGGSIRQPAAMCGVVGLKPTYGRVSRYGLIAFAPSFDQIGPFGRTVKDAALLLNVIAGRDRREATSARRDVPDYVAALASDLRRLKIGLLEETFGGGVAPTPEIVNEKLRQDFGRSAEGEDLDVIVRHLATFSREAAVEPGVRKAIDGAVAALGVLGHGVEFVSLPCAAWALPTYYVAVCAETYSNLARYQGVVFSPRGAAATTHTGMVAATRTRGFGAEVRRRVVAGAYALSIGYRGRYYAKAQELRQYMRAEFARAFEKYDFLLSPVSPFTTFPLNTRNLDPQLMYLADVFTGLPNLVGIPALSLPCGFDELALPVGLQIMARHWDEARLLALAHRLEEALALDHDVVTPAA